MKRFAQPRNEMVERQLVQRGIGDERVLAAMREVPRERFVPEGYRSMSYRDGPLPIEEGQTISQPYIVALMIEGLALEAGDRVLEVGAGSGYAAAVLARVADSVFAMEYHETLAGLAVERMQLLGYDNVEVRCGDGTLGWPEQAPFDAILVSAGGPGVPPTLARQLKVGGRMVIPIGDRTHAQDLLRVRRVAEDRYEQESLGRVQFVPLIGAEGWRGASIGSPRTIR